MQAITIFGKHASWTIIVFLSSYFFIISMLIWQLWDLTPKTWCMAARVEDPKNPMSCIQTLVRTLDIKDHAIIGLLGALTIMVVALSVVNLKLFVKADIPGGAHFDIGEDHTPPPTS